MNGYTPVEQARRDKLEAMTPEEKRRAAYIEGLRMLADALERHPEVDMPVGFGLSSPVLFYFEGTPEGTERMAAARKAFPCGWDKTLSGGGDNTDWFNLTGKLAGLAVQLYTERDAVCERIVTGTEMRPVEKVVQPAVTVEWRCHPLLEPEPESQAAAAGTEAAR